MTEATAHGMSRSGPVCSPRPISRRLHRLVWLMGFFMLAIAVPTAVVLQVQVRSTTMITTVVAPAYDANRQVLQAMSDGETGLRGYQLSGGEPSLLEPYGQGEQRTGAALRTVRTLLEKVEEGRPDRAVVLAAQAAQEKEGGGGPPGRGGAPPPPGRQGEGGRGLGALPPPVRAGVPSRWRPRRRP